VSLGLNVGHKHVKTSSPVCSFQPSVFVSIPFLVADNFSAGAIFAPCSTYLMDKQTLLPY